MSGRRGALSALLVTALLLGACGSDREDEAAPGETSSTTAPAGDAKWGTLESPCGGGEASGATDQGVTDDAVEIAFGDDSGYSASPGLFAEAGDAMEAIIEWCNDQGGINGRRIEGTRYDGKVTEVANVITEACRTAFFMVGEFFVLDNAHEKPRQECGLPAVAAAAGTAQFANAPLKWEGVPSAIDRVSTYAVVKLAEEFPDEIKTSGTLWGNYPVIVDRRDQVTEALPEYGYAFKPSCSVAYNVAGEADWKPLVQKLKDCGASFVYWVGSPAPNFQNALEAADQLDYHPIWYSDTNSYDPTFAKWNTNGFADKVYFRMAFLPFEEADEAPAVQQYLDLLEASGGETSQIGEQVISSFLLWATAAERCGSDLTRECVGDELAAIHEWDGGGMHAPSDPGRNEPPTCALMMRLDGTKFLRVAPEARGEFECDDSYVYEVPPTSDVLRRNKIGADRIAKL